MSFRKQFFFTGVHFFAIVGLISVCCIRGGGCNRPPTKSSGFLDVDIPVTRSIPDRLVFNDKKVLLGNTDTARGQNVNRILTIFPDISDVEFLDNEGCRAAIEKAHSTELATYFNKEQIGMYKSDICRLAQLALKGGYYMDTDLEVMQDIRKMVPPQASFASVIALPWKGPRNPNEIFQAFLATAPGHPVMRSSLDKCLEFYKGDNTTLSTLLAGRLQGTVLVRMAYEEWLMKQMQPGLQEKIGSDGSMYSFLFEEGRLTNQTDASDYSHIQPQIGEGINCNIAVFDRSTHQVMAWSHVAGTHDCHLK